MIKMQPLSVWILLGILFRSALTTSTDIIGLSQPECQHKAEVLFCDYKDTKRETVYLNFLEDDNLERVFIYNIRKLHLSKSACVNVTLHNIIEVDITKEDSTCSKPIELAAKQCHLNAIPGNIDSLYLEDCEVKLLTSEKALSKLTIINTRVKDMDIQSALTNGTKAVIQDSTVSSLNKLVAGSGSELLVRKSTLSIKKFNGIEIIGSKVSIVDSSVTGPEGGLTLQSGGTLTIGNQQGEITVSAGMSKCDVKNGQSNTLIIWFVLVLVLFLLSLALNIYILLIQKNVLQKPSCACDNKSIQIQVEEDVENNKTNKIKNNSKSQGKITNNKTSGIDETRHEVENNTKKNKNNMKSQEEITSNKAISIDETRHNVPKTDEIKGELNNSHNEPKSKNLEASRTRTNKDIKADECHESQTLINANQNNSLSVNGRHGDESSAHYSKKSGIINLVRSKLKKNAEKKYDLLARLRNVNCYDNNIFEVEAKIKNLQSKPGNDTFHKEIALRFEKINVRTSYLVSLIGEIFPLVKGQAKGEKKKTALNENSNIKQKSCIDEKLFAKHEEEFQLHIRPLTKKVDEEFLKNSLKINNELLPSFVYLSNELEKNSLMRRVLRHTAQTVNTTLLLFFLNLQYSYEVELVEMINLMETLLT